jgi:hypothetical protein
VAPLTDEETDIVEGLEKIRRKRAEAEVVTFKFKNGLNRVELPPGGIREMLSSTAWLDGETVHFALGCILQNNRLLLPEAAPTPPPASNGAAENQVVASTAAGAGPGSTTAAAPINHFFRVDFASRLVGRHGGEYTYDAVERWTTLTKLKYDILECEKIFIPANKDGHGRHWVMVVIDLKSKTITHYNPQTGREKSDDKLSQSALSWICDEYRTKRDAQAGSEDLSGWKINYDAHHPRQPRDNGWDCAVFVLKYAEFLSNGGAAVYKLNPAVDQYLESAWFQPLNLVSNLLTSKCNLHRCTTASSCITGRLDASGKTCSCTETSSPPRCRNKKSSPPPLLEDVYCACF